jgi:hypothetical protein
MLEFLVDGVYCEHGIFADIAMTVFKAGTAGWDERFKQLGILRDLLKESKGRATDVFIGVLLFPASVKEACWMVIPRLTKSFRIALLACKFRIRNKARQKVRTPPKSFPASICRSRRISGTPPNKSAAAF